MAASVIGRTLVSPPGGVEIMVIGSTIPAATWGTAAPRQARVIKTALTPSGFRSARSATFVRAHSTPAILRSRGCADTQHRRQATSRVPGQRGGAR